MMHDEMMQGLSEEPRAIVAAAVADGWAVQVVAEPSAPQADDYEEVEFEF